MSNTARERVVVYLHPIERVMLDRVCREAGETASELLRRLFKNYVEQMNLVRESLHGEKRVHKTS